jgi:mannose-6-phosphate isomerase-like protein (cupin superfamily)
MMLIRHLDDCQEFTAGDLSRLREILNPEKQPIPTSYSLAWAQVCPGERTRAHRLACSEVYFIIHGRGRMYINNEENDVQKHDTVYIPPHAVQSIENIGSEDLEFLCIVDPAWRPAVEEILDKQ